MRVHPGLLLLVLLISFAIIPPGAAASSSATLTITGEVVNPAPQDGDGGGGVTTGSGGGGGGGGRGGEGTEVVSAPNAVEPASQPAAPPSGGNANPPAENPPAPAAAPPAAPAGGPEALGAVPVVPVAQPGPLLSISSILTTYSSILWILLLLALAAAYAYTKRDVLSIYQEWITLYLISMTGVLWAAFVYATGGPLSESIFILTSVVGINLIVHVLRFDRIPIYERWGAFRRYHAV